MICDTGCSFDLKFRAFPCPSVVSILEIWLALLIPKSRDKWPMLQRAYLDLALYAPRFIPRFLQKG